MLGTKLHLAMHSSFLPFQNHTKKMLARSINMISIKSPLLSRGFIYKSLLIEKGYSFKGLPLNQSKRTPFILTNCFSSLPASQLFKKGTPMNGLFSTESVMLQHNLGIINKRLLCDRHILIRKFHSTPQKKFNGNEGPPNRRIKIIRIPSILLIFSSLGILIITLMILPLLISAFFPFLILGIALFQFRKWKQNTLYKQLLAHLKNKSKGHMSIKYSTLNSLQYKILNDIS